MICCHLAIKEHRLHRKIKKKLIIAIIIIITVIIPLLIMLIMGIWKMSTWIAILVVRKISSEIPPVIHEPQVNTILPKPSPRLIDTSVDVENEYHYRALEVYNSTLSSIGAVTSVETGVEQKSIIFDTVTPQEVDNYERFTGSDTTEEMEDSWLESDILDYHSVESTISPEPLLIDDDDRDFITKRWHNYNGPDKEQYKRGTDMSIPEIPTEMTEIPKSARCEPVPKLYHFEDNEAHDPDYGYTVPCTRVKRCNGCCDSSWKCEATSVVKRKFNVSVYLLPDRRSSGKPRIQDKVMEVDEHLDCQCECNLTKKDCGPREDVNRKSCKCECMTEDRRDCQNRGKWFNVETCLCSCFQEIKCHTYTKFDENTCKCIQDS